MTVKGRISCLFRAHIRHLAPVEEGRGGRGEREQEGGREEEGARHLERGFCTIRTVFVCKLRKNDFASLASLFGDFDSSTLFCPRRLVAAAAAVKGRERSAAKERQGNIGGDTGLASVVEAKALRQSHRRRVAKPLAIERKKPKKDSHSASPDLGPAFRSGAAYVETKPSHELGHERRRENLRLTNARKASSAATLRAAKARRQSARARKRSL